MSLILSANAGSSSLKLSLFFVISHGSDEDDRVSLVLTSTISSISSPPARFYFGNLIANELVHSILDHASAFEHFRETLHSKTSIDSQRIRYVCHRVVHGGVYAQPVEITEDSYHHIEKLSDLAPL